MKQMLLIMPEYYGYEEKIRQAFYELEVECDIVFENYYLSGILRRTVYKIVHKFPRIEDIFFTSFYRSQINKKKKYDYVLVIRGSSLTQSAIEEIKKAYPLAKYYLYLWDSVENNPQALQIESNFDSIKTFDMKDAKQYNWVYRPLFFISESDRKKSRKYLFSFICTNHSQRIKLYRLLKEKYSDSHSYYCFSVSPIRYFFEKYVKRNPDYDTLNIHDFTFDPISLSDVYSVMSDSEIVIDYTHPNQNGFTMRTIEALGNRCKLITNNKNIKDADCYDPQNVWIFNSIESFDINDVFKQTNYKEIDQSIRKKYSLKQWCRDLIEYE